MNSMSDAPKDGSPIVLYEDGEYTGANHLVAYSGWWDNSHPQWYKDGGRWTNGSRTIIPLGWTPLPKR